MKEEFTDLDDEDVNTYPPIDKPIEAVFRAGTLAYVEWFAGAKRVGLNTVEVSLYKITVPIRAIAKWRLKPAYKRVPKKSQEAKDV